LLKSALSKQGDVINDAEVKVEELQLQLPEQEKGTNPAD
jgi:hypothetical protein